LDFSEGEDVWHEVAIGNVPGVPAAAVTYSETGISLAVQAEAQCSAITRESVSYLTNYRDELQADRYGVNTTNATIVGCADNKPLEWSPSSKSPMWRVREVGMLFDPPWSGTSDRPPSSMTLNATAARVFSRYYNTEFRQVSRENVLYTTGKIENYTQFLLASDYGSECSAELNRVSVLGDGGALNCSVSIQFVCAIDIDTTRDFGLDWDRMPCWPLSTWSQIYAYTENFSADWFGVDEYLAARSKKRYTDVALALLANAIRNITTTGGPIPQIEPVVMYNSQCLYSVAMIVTAAVYLLFSIFKLPSAPFEIPTTVEDGYELCAREHGISENTCGAVYKKQQLLIGITRNEDENYDHIGITAGAVPYTRTIKGKAPSTKRNVGGDQEVEHKV
jgi:hypothetical protein